VNVAARIAELARGGEVLVSEAVCDAVRDLPGVHLGRLRRHAVKGTRETVRVCTATPA
jgi:class 3 adenylate cyclase